jgi:hypothetical protein
MVSLPVIVCRSVNDLPGHKSDGTFLAPCKRAAGSSSRCSHGRCHGCPLAERTGTRSTEPIADRRFTHPED